MPPNMSFAMTTVQIRDSSKSLTRRLGWWDFRLGRPRLRPGEHVQAVVKCMGLRKGEKVERIRMIYHKDSRREYLDALLPGRPYSYHPLDAWLEVCREGFPGWSPEDFVTFFCQANKCAPDVMVTRIEFGYVDLEKV